MQTCKKCSHYEVCRLGNLQYQTPYERYETKFIKKLDSSRCGNFKDRSKFIELPCEVGDTVYLITERTERIGRRKVTNRIIVECGVDNFRIGDAGYPSAALCDNDNNWYYGIEPNDFGDFVFLTKEQAEQALKERNDERK